jgi:hypothetical protein
MPTFPALALTALWSKNVKKAATRKSDLRFTPDTGLKWDNATCPRSTFIATKGNQFNLHCQRTVS